ncbi:MAG: glutamate-1-semialdehyde 2,1-aminomutase [Planctomycetota bacterium]
MTQTDRNAELFARACESLPGGVSSPVRAFGAVGGRPLFFDHAEGAHFVDANGDRYLDFVQSWGPLILGHAHPEVVAAVQDAASRGMTFGAPHQGEVELAERIKAQVPGVDRVRFTSSGTEATMSAIRLARGVTGRDLLLKFDGCYHGHSDGLLVAAGSGAITFGEPSSRGVPKATAELTVVLPLDDEEALHSFFQEHGDRLAAVILEPVPANNGLLIQRCEWLRKLQKLTNDAGALTIWDEVISGFRVGPGGAAELYDVRPDLLTYGKIVGGGMPCGAFCGRAELFDQLAPLGKVYQAGTLSGNPLAMAAGARVLEVCERDEVHARLGTLGARMEDRIESMLAERPHWRVGFRRLGSLFWFSFGSREVPTTAAGIHEDAAKLFSAFFQGCLRRKVYIAPSAYEVGFLSSAHTEEHVDHAVGVFAEALAETFGT